MDIGFDIFLSHNARDKPVVLQLAEQLKDRGFSVWIDVEELIAGHSFQEEIERVITSAASAAICIGGHGLGPWQELEMRACIDEIARRKLPVIPVLLPSGPDPSGLPVFLRDITCVDLRAGVTPAGVEGLARGIVGGMNVGMTRELTEELVGDEARREPEPQFVDAWGIASIKSRLYAMAELVAHGAAAEAELGASAFPGDALTLVVPLAVELRWKRGYAAALERMLRLPPSEHFVEELDLREVPGGCPVAEGVVSAREEVDGGVTLLLDGHPAVVLDGIDPARREAMIRSLNAHGRLGVPARGGMTVLERIGEIPIREMDPLADELTAALYQNREALAPLVARLGMPGSDWLLRDDEDRFARAAPPAGPGVNPSALAEIRARLAAAAFDVDEEVVDATGAVEDPARAAERMQAQWNTLLQSVMNAPIPRNPAG
jgi:hypothetical protein